MTLQTFIDDTLPDLSSMLRDQDCDHVLISSNGPWSARINGSWHAKPTTLSAETLDVLVQMCVDTPDANLVPPFAIHILAHPQHTTIALTRQHTTAALTLPDAMREALEHAIARGHNGLIIGPPSAPKELLLARLAASQTHPALYVSARKPQGLPAHAMLVAPPEHAPARRHLRTSMRVVEAAFWEDLHAPSHFATLWSAPGCQRRWCTMDAADPEAAFQAIATQALLLPAQTLSRIVWVEPYYHSDVPPIVLEHHHKMWRTSSTSALANFLVEQANLYLPLSSNAPRPLPEAPASLTQIDTSSLTLAIDHDPAPLEVERGGFSELLQTHVTPDNHLLSTHPGFGSRSIQEDSDAGIVLSSVSIHTADDEHEPDVDDVLSALAMPPELSLDDMSEEPVMFEELVDSEPDIIEASEASQVVYDPYELPHDPMAVTAALLPDSDESPTVTTLDELGDQYEELPVDATVPIRRDVLAEHYSDLIEPFEEEDATNLIPAPYDELKRMERELMTASHDEPTGIHPDFLDAPPAHRAASEDQISTSVKGTTDMSLPDDPEVFSSLNSPAQPPRQPPAAPEGIWQPAIADEPTQISFEHTNFASSQPAEAPRLAWGDDENTIQRQQNEATSSQAAPTTHHGATDTSSKLNTLSDRIKALREKQRLSGQFDALPQDGDDPWGDH